MAQAIPAYCMNIFLIPISILHELQRMLNGYWWGGKREVRQGINWLAWGRMCSSKRKGGMGFRDFRSFNLALLCKQVWRFLTNTNTLCYRVFKSKYFPNGDLLSTNVSNTASFVWRSVMASRDLLSRGTRWRIGNGEKVLAATDPWLPKEDSFYADDGMVFIDPHIKVCDLLEDNGRKWNIAPLLDLFSIRDIQAIITIPISLNSREDSLMWHFDKKDLYTVKSAHHVCLDMGGQHTDLGGDL